MKRIHVHIVVEDLEEATGFYAALFGSKPTVRKSDYAKWQLDDPLVNFAISTSNSGSGLSHLGVQVETAAELEQIADRLSGWDPVQQVDANCCYSRSDKVWSVDPAGLAWETFLTHGSIDEYGVSREPRAVRSGCCGPRVEQ